ncbi:MAG: hypothetical protein JWN27_201 [Candidatus Eremiobacteraeota bacterium]|nr:hypothetical protein [Candidatus Eremiobacteraeota bacterium]
MINATKPTLFERSVNVIARWVAWFVLGYFVYSVVVVVIAGAVWHQHLSFGAVARLLGYNVFASVVAAGVVISMIVGPYAYVVWGQPTRKFWGETLPWPTALWRGAAAGLVLGIALGLVWPLIHSHR